MAFFPPTSVMPCRLFPSPSGVHIFGVCANHFAVFYYRRVGGHVHLFFFFFWMSFGASPHLFLVELATTSYRSCHRCRLRTRERQALCVWFWFDIVFLFRWKLVSPNTWTSASKPKSYSNESFLLFSYEWWWCIAGDVTVEVEQQKPVRTRYGRDDTMFSVHSSSLNTAGD